MGASMCRSLDVHLLRTELQRQVTDGFGIYEEVPASLAPMPRALASERASFILSAAVSSHAAINKSMTSLDHDRDSSSSRIGGRTGCWRLGGAPEAERDPQLGAAFFAEHAEAVDHSELAVLAWKAPAAQHGSLSASHSARWRPRHRWPRRRPRSGAGATRAD